MPESSINEYLNPTLWIEITITLVIGLIIMQVLIRSVRMLFKKSGFSPLIAHPLVNILRWTAYLLLATMVLGKFGHNMFTILSTMLAMVAIGFVAVWSLLSHVSSTLLLIITKPFKINDVIEFAGEQVKGRVVDLNLFYTTLRTPDGDFFQIPNNMFFQKTIRKTPAEKHQQIELEKQLPEQQPAA